MDEREARSVIEGEPSFDETVMRAEIDRDIRDEYATADLKRREGERDMRVLALVISIGLAVGFFLPLLALCAGFSWRVLMWSSGEGW